MTRPLTAAIPLAAIGATLDVLAAPAWVLDDQGEAVFLNRACAALAGLPAEELLGPRWWRMVAPSERQRLRAAWEDAAQAGTPHDLDIPYADAAGRARWHQVRAEPLRSDGGPVAGWMGISVDIHERRERELEAAGHARAMGALTELTADVVFTATPAGVPRAGQASWARFTGQPEGSYAPAGWIRAFHAEDRNLVLQTWAAALSDERPRRLTARLWRAPHDGEPGGYRLVDCTATPVARPDGTVSGWVGAISERPGRPAPVAPID